MFKNEFVKIANEHSAQVKRENKARSYSKRVSAIREFKFNINLGILTVVITTVTVFLSNTDKVFAKANEVENEPTGIVTVLDTNRNVWDYYYTYDLSEEAEWSQSEIYVISGYIIDTVGNCEDWEVGDKVHLILSDNGTYETNTDDILIKMTPATRGVELKIN